MYRVSPTPLSFTPNILQTVYIAKSSPQYFRSKFLEQKKLGIFFLTPKAYPLPP